MSVGFVSRSTGRSAVQSAAYISGEKLHESRRGLDVDYRNRHSDVTFCQTFAPAHAPEWMKDLSVWDKLESYEDQYALQRYKSDETREKYLNSAQTAQTYVMALPKELTPQVWQELMTDFVEERFLARNLIATVAIHNDEGNPHAHIMVSRRSVTQEGEFSFAKDREITTKTELKETRKLWAEKANTYLEREGFEARIDHRSFADLGISFEPTKKEGWYANKLEEMGEVSRIAVENQEIKLRNKERAALNPEAILTELTTNKATFSLSDLARQVQARVGDDTKLCQAIFEQAKAQAIEVGVSLDGQARFTSKDYQQAEDQALSFVEILQEKTPGIQISPSLVQDKITAVEQEKSRGSGEFSFSEQQKQAVETLCSDSMISVMIGRAGTGKTTTLQAVVEAHKASGFDIVGMSLSAAASENLGQEAGCASETIAFYLDKWEKYEAAAKKQWSTHTSSEQRVIENTLNRFESYQLTDKHVIIIDEAGMVGTRTWESLLHFANKAGTKVIAVGDDNQFKAIEAGDFFRKLIDQARSANSYSVLEAIVRQRHDWMKQASFDLAELRTFKALSAYEQHGHIVGQDKADLIETIAEDYIKRITQQPDKMGLVLASTRAQVQTLNEAIRGKLIESGHVRPQEGEGKINDRSFAIGDRLVFLKNDRLGAIKALDNQGKEVSTFMVKNGTQGKIESIQPITTQNDDGEILTSYRITARINNNFKVEFSTQNYGSLDHGYALTLYKSQGKTVEWVLALASKVMDAYASYVALTRHREEVTVYYDKSEFGSFKELQQSLSRLSGKDLVMDYTIPDHKMEAWSAVQDYLLLGQDMAATAKEKQWSQFNTLKAERQSLGKHILSEWQDHQEYAKQAGLTLESIQITCGLKQRPLSIAEQMAQIRVSDYAEKAQSARILWQEIRKTHPGKSCVQHALYESFSQLRQERDALAQEIAAYPSLHREFVGQAYQSHGISLKAIQAQAQRFEERVRSQKQKEENISFHTFSRTFQREERVNAEEIKQDLHVRMSELATKILGDPVRKTSREWRYGNKGAVAVFVAGTKQGFYSNFETGVHGGPFTLIQDQLNLNFKEALQWAKDWLGHDQVKNQTRVAPPREQKPIDQKQWTPLYPVPGKEANPNISNNKYLNYQLKDKTETHRFAYKDADGKLLGYVIRLENQAGDKVTLPLTYCENSKGQRAWKWQGFGNDRPLYGLDKLKTYPDKPILIVEGEKTAESAQKLLPNHNVLTWCGGTGSVSKTDWSPLVGKEITIWPDNDEPGVKAANVIKDKLNCLNEARGISSNVKIIDLPKDLPKKWDLADTLPKGWSVETIQGMILSTPKDLKTPEKQLAQSKDKHNEYKAAMETLRQSYQPSSAHQKAMEDLKKSYQPSSEYQAAMEELRKSFKAPSQPVRSQSPLSTNPSFVSNRTAPYRNATEVMERIKLFDLYELKGMPIKPEEKADLEKRMVELGKDKKAMDYVRSTNPDMAKKIERVHQEYEKQALAHAHRDRKLDLTF